MKKRKRKTWPKKFNNDGDKKKETLNFHLEFITRNKQSQGQMK